MVVVGGTVELNEVADGVGEGKTKFLPQFLLVMPIFEFFSFPKSDEDCDVAAQVA